MSRNFEKKVEKALERYRKEKELNLLNLKKSEGMNVKYGNEIQIMHADSKAFICAKSECANTSHMGIKVQLERDLIDQQVFRIYPKYKTRKEGDFIQYNDSFFFQNVTCSQFLSTSPHNFETARDFLFVQENP